MIFAAYIAAITILLAYAQVALKWRLAKLPPLSASVLAAALADPVIISCFAAIGLASLLYLSMLPKYELNRIYPFMAINFVLVILGSHLFLGESLTLLKITGVLTIVLGVALAARG